MTTERRLRAVEARLGLGGGGGGETPTERSLRAIDAGMAHLSDFRRVLGPHLRTYQAWIVVQSHAFREMREYGYKPMLWWPAELAAATVAVPLDEEPDPSFGADLVKRTRLGRFCGSERAKKCLSEAGQGACFELWEGFCVMLVCLGQPDGLPLREAVARGEFDDAGAVVRAAGLKVPSHAELTRCFTRWLTQSGQATQKSGPSTGRSTAVPLQNGQSHLNGSSR